MRVREGGSEKLAGRANGRLLLAVGVAIVHGALFYLLLSSSTVNMPAAVRESLTLIDVRPDPPPPERPPPRRRSVRDKGASQPPNKMAKPVEVVAPPPVVQVAPPPPPIIAAPVAGTGPKPTAGASEIGGPGTGGGGSGDASGAGTGDGDGGTHSRWLSGQIRRSDYPRAALEAGHQGTVVMRIVVGPKGRVTDCSVTRSSGSPILDAATCRLIMRRYRYEPGRDASGRPTYDEWVEEQTWVIHEREEEEDEPESSPPMP